MAPSETPDTLHSGNFVLQGACVRSLRVSDSSSRAFVAAEDIAEGGEAARVQVAWGRRPRRFAHASHCQANRHAALPIVPLTASVVSLPQSLLLHADVAYQDAEYGEAFRRAMGRSAARACAWESRRLAAVTLIMLHVLPQGPARRAWHEL